MNRVIVRMGKNGNVLQKKYNLFSANFNTFYLLVSKYLLTHTHTHTHTHYIYRLFTQSLFFTFLPWMRIVAHILINTREKSSLMCNAVCSYVSLRAKHYGLQMRFGVLFI